jgi:hypothetical protein
MIGKPDTPGRRLRPDLPAAGAWQELKVPLVWLGLHDQPIHGIFWGQDAGSAAVWDRTALAGTGAETVLVEDDLPEGRARGPWSWVDKPVFSGTKAHTYRTPSEQDQPAWHQVAELQAPFIAHLKPPASSPVLGQSIFLDPNLPPVSVSITLHGELGVSSRCAWGLPAPGARYMGPLGAPGQWQELGLPLAWTPLAQRPITGLEFSQDGGRAWWDRTALRLPGGREEILIEDEAPAAGELQGWKWVEEPRRSGRLAREMTARGRECHAARGLATPLRAHLPFDAPEALSFLEAQLPKLGASPEALSFLEAMLRLEGEASRRLARCRWFLEAQPSHPQAAEVLGKWTAELRNAGRADPKAEIEAFIAAGKIPPMQLYQWRRAFPQAQRLFLREWQVLGPFPGRRGHEAPYAPEGRPVNLQAQYSTPEGAAIGWNLMRSDRNYVDFGRSARTQLPATGYAACWLVAAKAQPLVLEISADSACKVWLNSRPVHEHVNFEDAKPGDHQVRLFLAAGPNELLVKATQRGRDWGFFAELVDAEGRGVPVGVKVTVTQP